MKKKTLIYTICLLITVSVSAQKSNKNDKSESKKATSKDAKTPASSEHEVLISTSLGDMKVRLYDATPQHRDNFVKLTNAHFYDSLLFHRVISNFMIQGGDPLSKNAAPGAQLGMGDNGYTIPAEFVDSLFHKKGAICAARTPNPEKASSGCQFYIVQGQALTLEQINQMTQQRGITLTDAQKKIYSTLGGTPFLDKDYTVFGEVYEGLDVLDKIAAVKTAPGDRPIQDVYILKMTLIK